MTPKNPDDIYQKRDLIMQEIHTNLNHLVKNFDQHVIDDKAMALDVKNQLAWQSRVLYTGIGIVAFVVFLSRMI